MQCIILNFFIKKYIFNCFLQCGLTPEQMEKLKPLIIDCGGKRQLYKTSSKKILLQYLMIDNCFLIVIVAKEGASEADVQEVLSHKPPSSHAGKCVGACVGEAGGMVGQYSRNYVNWISFHFFEFFYFDEIVQK